VNELLHGRNVLVLGVANEHSIAWAITKAVLAAGGRVALSYQAPRLRPRLQRLLASLQTPAAAAVPLLECDVRDDGAIAAAIAELEQFMPELHGLVHSVAWAPAEDLRGSFASTTRAGFAAANDVSAYSLVAVAREASRLLVPGSSLVTMTYAGSRRVIPNYNVMGPAKASLEACVRYLAADVGPAGVRVNAISAGPIHTVAARTIKDFDSMLELLRTHTPLRRTVTADEVADTAVFLLSDLSRGITGEIIHVDAGAHAVI
jgi:enoyl-[acyl-carrier protein] reductase I